VLVLLFGQVFTIPGFVIALEMVPDSWSFGVAAVTAALGYLAGSIPMLFTWERLVPLVEKNA
jgi:hypothetical protein